MMHSRFAILLAGAVLGVFCGSGPALAETVVAPKASAATDLIAFGQVSDKELARYRGGFVWKGVQVSLGAEIRTFLNGQLVLQTNVTWTPNGAQTSQFVSGALTPVDAAQLQAGILSTGGISMKVGDQSVFLANGGQTVFAQATDGRIQNILINRADNITAKQEIDATLGLQNFGQFQQQNLQSHIGTSAGDMVGQAISGFLGY
jgi:hypothetical protein